MRFLGAGGRLGPLILLAFAALAALGRPELAALALVAALLLLVERAATDRKLRRLAAALAADDPEAKLEVSGGAWGELCHTINRLLQQRRSEQRLQRLLAAPPPPLAVRLAEIAVPHEGLPCEVAVLAIGPLPGPEEFAVRLQATAAAAAGQAELHGALLSRSGERILLIFGALGEPRAEPALRVAQRAALGLHDAWPGRPEPLRPALSLAGGAASALVLPGLGYSVVGAPVDQALALLESGRPGALICSESAYVSLRRLGSAPPLSIAPRLSPAAGPPAYAVPL